MELQWDFCAICFIFTLLPIKQSIPFAFYLHAIFPSSLWQAPSPSTTHGSFFVLSLQVLHHKITFPALTNLHLHIPTGDSFNKYVGVLFFFVFMVYASVCDIPSAAVEHQIPHARLTITKLTSTCKTTNQPRFSLCYSRLLRHFLLSNTDPSNPIACTRICKNAIQYFEFQIYRGHQVCIKLSPPGRYPSISAQSLQQETVRSKDKRQVCFPPSSRPRYIRVRGSYAQQSRGKPIRFFNTR